MGSQITSYQGSWTQWTLKCCNIIDEPADVLICSANVSLNLSGGVGAELLGRYGLSMQQTLHSLIATRTPRAAKVGEVVSYSGEEMPYKAVLHAVAVDGWYHSTPLLVQKTVRTALDMAAKLGAAKVACVALATGFGDLTLAEFSHSIHPLLNDKFRPVEEVMICLMQEDRLAELAGHLFQAGQAK